MQLGNEFPILGVCVETKVNKEKTGQEKGVMSHDLHV